MRAADASAITPADVLGALNDVESKYAPREALRTQELARDLLPLLRRAYAAKKSAFQMPPSDPRSTAPRPPGD